MQGSKGIILLGGLVLCVGMIARKGLALSPEVRNLGPVVNSEESDFAPVVSPDGNYLFFTSDRGGGQGGQDIWVSKRENGEWSPPVNLGPPINTNLNQGPDCFLKVRALLAENPEVKIEVSGHACSMGDLDYNQLLSNARSEAVRKYLMNQGIAPDRMRVAFYGETRPAEPNDPVQGNPLNRRVEISIQ